MTFLDSLAKPTQLVRSHSVLAPSMTSRFYGNGGVNKSPANQWPASRVTSSGARMTRDVRRTAYPSAARVSCNHSPQTTERLTFNGQRVQLGWPPVNY